jgi:Tfp pilus assembly protein PilN
MITFAPLRKLLAYGTGVGVELGAADLSITVVRVRPSGVRVAASFTVAGYLHHPAAEWGAELTTALAKHGLRHVAVNVLLPREDVIVRQVTLPGVTGKNIPAALAYQVDSLHPFGDETIVWDWAQIGNSPNILVGIALRTAIDRFATLFSEAGVRVSSFTFSAALLYSSFRLLKTPPAAGFLTLLDGGDGQVEAYGESESRGLFSARFELPLSRAAGLAASELRLGLDVDPTPLRDLLPQPQGSGMESDLRALPYAAALAAACPLLALRANLLPPELRHTSSRLMYVPAAVLAVILLVSAAAIGVQAAYEDRRYLASLQSEIAKLEPSVRQSETKDRRVGTARDRTRLLDEFRQRTRSDMDVLKEATRLLPPPTWLSGIEITRDTVSFAGSTEQAAPLVKVFDSSPLFEGSDFVSSITRDGSMESFRIRSRREARKK